MTESFTTTVEPGELAAHLRDPRWVVVDCRHELNDPSAGREAYRLGHIPGARFVSVEEDLSGARTGRNGRHPLPEVGAISAKLGARGIQASTQVVAYDAQGGIFAARMWWTLRWLGHFSVAVLDGGWQRWLEEGGPSTAERPSVRPLEFIPKVQALEVDVQSVLQNLTTGDRLVVDARAPDRYRGENETLDPVGGHIPGAINRYYRDNLDAEGRFKPAAALREEWKTVLSCAAALDTIHQCGSGVSACHNLLALEIAGLGGGKLFAGSWSEWCADPGRPVATGKKP